MRTRTPAQTESAAKDIQRALQKLIETTGKNYIPEGTSAFERVYLPSKRKGMGFENLTDLRYRAFSAGLLDALPAMIDREYDDDEDDSTTNKGMF